MVAHIGAIHLIMVTVAVAHQAVAPQVTAMVIQVVVVLERLDKALLAAAAKVNITQVVEAARTIPVIGNGDVTTPEAAVHMKSETGCAGVSVGRGAFYDPWIFVRTRALMQTGVLPPEPGIEDRVRVMSRHPVPLPLAAGSVPPIYTKGDTLAYF